MLDVDYTAPLTNGTLAIDIPGTDSWLDMLNNMRLGRRVVHGCRVNRLDRAEALHIIRAEREKIQQAKEIYIYGHSRGGAIALQIWWEILDTIPLDCNINVTVTAAKPTGDRAFVYCAHVDGVVTAYRQRGDIIPFLPPWQPNIRHVRIGKWQPFWKAHAVRNYRGLKPWNP